MEKIPAFYFENNKLDLLANNYRDDFLNAIPFNHVIIDNIFPDYILDLLIEEFPDDKTPAWIEWGEGPTISYPKRNRKKRGLHNERYFGPFTRHFMGQLISHTFIQFLTNLTNIENIIVDPSFSSCGLHSTGRGGNLMVHADSNRHPIKSGDCIHQVLNLILYINKDWKDEYGGDLELWNRERTKCIKSIKPIYNRCVIFDTGKYSYHGHPHPLNCPKDIRRNSIASYYYTVDRKSGPNYSGIMRKTNWILTTENDKSWSKISAPWNSRAMLVTLDTSQSFRS